MTVALGIFSFGTAMAIMWNPSIINTPHGPRPPFIALAHQLIHAWHNLMGDTLSEDRWKEMATVGLFQYENYRQTFTPIVSFFIGG